MLWLIIWKKLNVYSVWKFGLIKTSFSLFSTWVSLHQENLNHILTWTVILNKLGSVMESNNYLLVLYCSSLVSHFVLCNVLLHFTAVFSVFNVHFWVCFVPLHSLLLSFHNFHNGNAAVCGVNTMKWKSRKQQFDSSDYWDLSASDNICTHMSPSPVNIGFLSGKAPLLTALWQEKCFQKELLPDFYTLTDNVW